MSQHSSSDLAGFAKLNAENFSKIRQALNAVLEGANRHWMARAKSEADLASELTKCMDKGGFERRCGPK